MPEQPADLRSELAAATRILASHHLIGMFGDVSVLTEDPRRYLVGPGAGARKDRCRASDVLELDLDHEFGPGLPLELYMHSEVHRLKPHIRSLIHVHSPALVALAAMAKVPSDLLMLHASFWPATMPVWDEADLVRDRAAAQRLIGILGDEAITLLRWHGAVIVGRTLHEAVFRAILAEEHAGPRGSAPPPPGSGAGNVARCGGSPNPPMTTARTSVTGPPGRNGRGTRPRCRAGRGARRRGRS